MRLKRETLKGAMTRQTANRFFPEVKERAVRMVFGQRAEHATEWVAICPIAGKTGCTGETLRSWVRQAERDNGVRAGPAADDRERLKARERENRGPRRARSRARRPRISPSDWAAKRTNRLAGAGIKPSIGSSYGNALAGTVDGLYKTEVIRRRGPWRSIEAAGFATLEWAEPAEGATPAKRDGRLAEGDWFNNRRLLEPIGNIPPAGAGAPYHASLEELPMAALRKQNSLRQIRGG